MGGKGVPEGNVALFFIPAFLAASFPRFCILLEAYCPPKVVQQRLKRKSQRGLLFVGIFCVGVFVKMALCYALTKLYPRRETV